MSSIQIIKTPAGEDMVVLPKSEYDELLRIAEEAAEDAADIAIYDSRIKEMSAQLPAEVSMAILRGFGRLKALRSWRGLTQNELAFAVGVGQGFISDLESRRRAPSGETLTRLAAALDVPRGWLEG